MKRKILRSRSPRAVTIRDEHANITLQMCGRGDDPPSWYFPNATSEYEKSRSFCRVTYTRVVAFSLKKARLWRQTSHRKLSLAVDVCASACVHTYGYIIHGNKIWFLYAVYRYKRARTHTPARASTFICARLRAWRVIFAISVVWQDYHARNGRNLSFAQERKENKESCKNRGKIESLGNGK